MSTSPVLTALFPANKAAFLAASQLFDSGFAPDQIQPIFGATQPTSGTRQPRAAAIILHPHHRADEARTILLEHGAELV